MHDGAENGSGLFPIEFATVDAEHAGGGGDVAVADVEGAPCWPVIYMIYDELPSNVGTGEL